MNSSQVADGWVSPLTNLRSASKPAISAQSGPRPCLSRFPQSPTRRTTSGGVFLAVPWGRYSVDSFTSTTEPQHGTEVSKPFRPPSTRIRRSRLYGREPSSDAPSGAPAELRTPHAPLGPLAEIRRAPGRKTPLSGAATVHPGNKAGFVSTQIGTSQNCDGYKKGYKVQGSQSVRETKGPRLRAFLSSGGTLWTH